MSQDMAKVWVAYHHDYSEFAVFTDELACLRYALEHTMEAALIDVGRGVREQDQERRAEVRARFTVPDAEPPRTDDEPLGCCMVHGNYWTDECPRCGHA